MGDSVATVALVVSLIALVIAVAQLLQQLFSTADGYRRCSEAVIDAWHTLRRRERHWTELRLETRFTTPEIIIVTPHELREAENVHEIYYINSPILSEQDCPCKELQQTVHKAYALNSPSSTSKESEQWNVEKPKVDVENQDSADTARKLRYRNLNKKRQQGTENELLVTWLRLLRELHALYYSYQPEDCPHCSSRGISPGWTQADLGHSLKSCLLDSSSQTRSVREDAGKSSENVARTEAAIIYRQRSWDFMPPDLVRPLAESNIGDIVILSRRLNMQWRVLDLENGRLQADGNGYSLSSTDVKAIGLVLRFSAVGHHSKFPRIIPSRAVDKFLCGILPGDPILVKQDLDVLDSECRRIPLHAPGGFFTRINVPEEILVKIRKSNFEEVHNEPLMLMCSFLPLEHSNIVSYDFHGFRPSPASRKSVFHYWEGRHSLLQKLRARINSEKKHQRYEDLVEVYTAYAYLEKEFPDDFYCRHDKGAITNGRGPIAKEQLAAYCRKIFDDTTAYFEDRDFNAVDAEGRTRYLHLIAAHACMAQTVVEKIMDDYERNKGKENRQQRALREKYGFTEKHGRWVFQLQVDIGNAYADYARDPVHGIAKYLSFKGLEFDDDEAEALWWKLILRGLVWDMGSWARLDPGDPLPPKLYGNKTPVWIT